MPIIVDSKRGSPARTVLYFILALANLVVVTVLAAKIFFEKQPETNEAVGHTASAKTDMMLLVICSIGAVLFFLMAVSRFLTSDD